MKQLALAVLLIVGICLIPLGYIFNVIELCKTDFASPYKAEVLRIVGVAVPPIGVVMGYIDIEDGQQE